VDIGMGFGCNLFGHAPAFVTRAIQEQAERGYGLGPQSPLAGRAADLVCRLGGNDRAVFCNSGSEAVMGAIRAARAFTGRRKVAMFAGAYHGWSDIVQGRLVTTGGRREVRAAGPGLDGLPLQDVIILDWDQPSTFSQLAEHIHEVALVMVEPVQSRRPDIQPRDFLHELRRVTKEAGALLLFDELITGFRIGSGGAQAHFGVHADLVTYGKIVAGGLPMGVVAGRREVMDVFDGGVWSFGDDSYPTAQRTLFAGAYFKHPISMGVACAVLGEIESRGPAMYAALEEKSARLVGRMNAFFEAGTFPVTAVHFGSMFRFFFGPEVKFPDLFAYHLPLEGVYAIPETGTCFLSDAHTDEDVDTVFRAVRAAVEGMRRGGFIPGPAGAPASPSGAGEGAVRPVPLGEGQRQLWIESQMGEAASLAYVESTSIRLRGPLDVERMRACLQTLVNRHDALRSTFGPEGDVQFVHPARELEVPLADFRGVAAGERPARVEAWLRRTVRRPFDLAAGPLSRFDLAAVGDDEHLLVMSAHHAALDGWSFTVLIRELTELYAAAREGRAPRLAPPPRFDEQVHAQVDASRTDAQAEAFWLAQFADGVPVLDLPSDRPRPAVRSYRGERVRHVMADGIVHRVGAMGRGHGFTVFHTVLSAFLVWLARLSGQDDVVVGTPSAGQAATPGAGELVGYAINVLPVRARVDVDAPFLDHAKRVRRTVLQAVQHQHFSVPRLVKQLLRTRDPGRPPLYPVMMNLDRGAGDTPLGDLTATFESNFAGGCKVDLRFAMTEIGDGLVLDCEYATDLYDEATVRRWLASFERLLEEVAAHPALPVGDLRMGLDDGLDQLVDAFCDAELNG
jgi:glutamate-1-semialdehyde aminotransferase